MTYCVPNEIGETTYEIKKSLFHGRASKASNREEAFAFLELCKQLYPDARHHCWAYVFGSPKQPVSLAMSDDGEPSGTAGKPILNVLQHNHVGDVMLVVSRYFGGTKLGAGGLVRAYSTSAKQTIEQLSVTEYVALTCVNVITTFKHEQMLRHFIEVNSGQIDHVHYDQSVNLIVSIPSEALPELKALCANVSANLNVV